ncbi:MAG: primosomal protein N' [Actinobacteria bacterium]|nr:primosomal protein N' [Actinomycetota bacterium]
MRHIAAAPASAGAAAITDAPPERPTWQVAPLMGVRSLGDRVFDYLPPQSHPEGHNPQIGRLVRVPFGRRQVVGVVLGVGCADALSGIALRHVHTVLPRAINQEGLELARDISVHFVAPLGAALGLVAPQAHAPAGLGQGRKVGWIRPLPNAVPERPLTARQREVLRGLPTAGCAMKDACRMLKCTRGVLNALVAHGVAALEQRTEPVDRNDGVPDAATSTVRSSSLGDSGSAADKKLTLTAGQSRALDWLVDRSRKGGFDHVLLWGVTGSGKTEVYMRLLQEVVGSGRQAIVLVPEIALTAALAKHVEEGLGPGVAAVLHSGLTPAARARTLRRIEAGEASVVVGPRSAVFAPLDSIGLIVIDESHDSSFKNEEEPRYNARWVALWRARKHGALVLEGTATPRLETWVETRKTLRLGARPAGAELPEVEVIDMRRQAGSGALSPRAAAQLRDTIAAGEQAILLINRRGHSGYLFCPECGWVAICPRCDIALTMYRPSRGMVGGVLMCRHCGHRTAVPEVCMACGQAAVVRGVAGTQRVEEELHGFLPAEQIFRLDSDSAGRAGQAFSTLEAFAATSPGVLLGTQMVAKGHDFPQVTLVVVVDADAALYLPDFRAAERTFHLLRQVMGRAGRRRRPGLALVQTWNPETPCIRMALEGDERGFYRQELEERRSLGFPPATSLVRVVLAGSVDRVDAAADQAANTLRSNAGTAQVWGVTRLPRLRSVERRQLLFVAGPGDRQLPPEVRRCLLELRSGLARRAVDVIVDVDPEWFS